MKVTLETDVSLADIVADLPTHQRFILQRAVINLLEQTKRAYFASNNHHRLNTADAAWEQLKVLRLVRPEAADHFIAWHGTPKDWTAGREFGDKGMIATLRIREAAKNKENSQ